MAKCWLVKQGNLEKDAICRLKRYYTELIKLDPLREGHYKDCFKVF